MADALILGRYAVRRRIGQGAMGAVDEAWDTTLERRVAIKHLLMPDGDPAAAAAFADRFQREARILAALNHPNIVTIYEAVTDHAQNLLVMEYLDGQSLADCLRVGTRFSLAEVLEIGLQIAAGLAGAHKAGIVHRDVKPANIMLLADGRVKVMDFGIAKPAGAAPLTMDGTVLGTPGYMAPEQITGGVIDGRSDLFALGVLLYQMTTGESPFPGTSFPTVLYKIVHMDPTPPSHLVPGLTAGLDLVITRCLAKDPQQRYQTAAEVMEALRAVAQGTHPPGPHRPLPVFQHLPRAGRPRWLLPRRKALVALLVIVAVGVIAIAAILLSDWWLRGNQDQRTRPPSPAVTQAVKPSPALPPAISIPKVTDTPLPTVTITVTKNPAVRNDATTASSPRPAARAVRPPVTRRPTPLPPRVQPAPQPTVY